MNTLKQTTVSSVDISSSEATIFTYTLTETLLVIAQLVIKNIAGGGTYTVHFYIDGILTVPDQNITISGTSAVIQSRSILVAAGSVITIAVLGLPGDSAVSVVTTLADASPISVEEVVTVLEPELNHIIDEAVSGVTVRPTKTVLGVCKPRKRKCPPRRACP